MPLNDAWSRGLWGSLPRSASPPCDFPSQTEEEEEEEEEGEDKEEEGMMMMRSSSSSSSTGNLLQIHELHSRSVKLETLRWTPICDSRRRQEAPYERPLIHVRFLMSPK